MDYKMRFANVAGMQNNKALKEAAAEILAELGFNRWIYVSENPYTTSGIPAILGNELGLWIIRYLTKGYMKIDPVVLHCQSSIEPFFWGTDDMWEDERQKAMMADAADHGFGSGLAIPLRLKNEPQGLLNVTSAESISKTRPRLEVLLPQLQGLGLAMHAAMIGILKDVAVVHEKLQK